MTKEQMFEQKQIDFDSKNRELLLEIGNRLGDCIYRGDKLELTMWLQSLKYLSQRAVKNAIKLSEQSVQ